MAIDKKDKQTQDMFDDEFTVGDRLIIHRKARELAEKIVEEGIPIYRIFKDTVPEQQEEYDENGMVIRGYN